RDIPRLELETTFDNRARDHRLRVCFDWIGLKPLAMQTISDAPFDTVARPCLDSQAADGASTFYPQQSWAAFTGNLAPEKVKTMTLISQGLPEYEAFLREGRIVQKIALTLLRCVGYLSRRGDGPQIETPEAQCLGVHRFRYAIRADDRKAGPIARPAAVAVVRHRRAGYAGRDSPQARGGRSEHAYRPLLQHHRRTGDAGACRGARRKIGPACQSERGTTGDADAGLRRRGHA